MLPTAELSGSSVFSGVWAPRKGGSTQYCGQQNCLDPVYFLVSGHQVRLAPRRSADSRTFWIQCVFCCLGVKRGWLHPVLRTAQLSGSSVFSGVWAPRKGGSTQFCVQQSCLDPLCFLVSGHQLRVAPPSSADSRTVWIQCVFWCPSTK